MSSVTVYTIPPVIQWASGVAGAGTIYVSGTTFDSSLLSSVEAAAAADSVSLSVGTPPAYGTYLLTKGEADELYEPIGSSASTIDGGTPSAPIETLEMRRGPAATWTSDNPVLAQGEPGFETDTGQFKIGDGSTHWTGLPYAGGATTTTINGGTSPSAVDTIELRHDPAANWTANNPTLGLGEPGFEDDTGSLKVGDGVSTWTALDYVQGNVVLTDGTNFGGALVLSDTTPTGYAGIVVQIPVSTGPRPSDVGVGSGSPSQGDILYYNGSAWVDLPASTSGYVLTTNGAGANPSWSAPSAGLPSAPSIYYAAGSGTWTKPAGVTWVRIVCVGGGAGGGSTFAPSTAAAQAGGSGGGIGASVERIVNVSAVSSLSWTVGAGGNGGAAATVGGTGNNGNNGGDSTVTGTGISVTASGGEGGQPAASGTTQVTGGSYGKFGRPASVNMSGSPGQGGNSSVAGNGVQGGWPVGYSSGAGGGGGAASTTNGGGGGGCGTDAIGGAGGVAGASGTTAGTQGTDAAAPSATGVGAGAGGGGAGASTNSGTPKRGGNGADGMVMIQVIG